MLHDQNKAVKPLNQQLFRFAVYAKDKGLSMLKKE